VRHTTGSIAATLRAELIGPSDITITGVDSIDAAEPGSLTFVRSGRFANRWAASRASAVLVTRGVDVPGHDPATRALIIVDSADVAMVALLRMFSPPSPACPPGVHPTSLVDPSARIGQGVHVGPFCTVGPNAVIGDGSILFSHVTIGAEVSIGPICRLHPGVRVLERCSIGAACELWPNVVIGADGFGYVPAPDRRGLLKVPHIGTVEIGDAVDIGACSCVDRGKFGATTIGAGTKIDNHVQVGHNVRIGRSVIVCGMVGIGGSATIGDGVIIAGHAGVSDGLTVGPGATISAKSGVMCDVPAGEVYFGTPAGPHKDQMRAQVALRKLSGHLRTLKRLERSLHPRAGDDDGL
jgi:UDP-3-O-[3-hydroxymyristoyl] glucosamine N-acyltransferase